MVEGKQRQSGIELLKILAMIMIVISHITITLGVENAHYALNYVYKYQNVSRNIQSLMLAWFRTFGAQGNLIFFVCSAWFLVESRKVNYKKNIRMLADVWVINISILIIFELGGWYEIFSQDVKGSIFPTIYATNWYITCYILFYLIHLMLNRIINSLTQKEFLTTNIISLFLYFGIGYIHDGVFFVSNLILFIVVYFEIAYLKIYMKDFCVSKSKNVIMLIVGIGGTPIMILLTNFIGLHSSHFQDMLTYWGRNTSPFLLITAIAMFNLFKSQKFANNVVNNIASLSLLIYIIHENLLLRTYVRPQIWIFIYEKFGYSNIVMWVLLQAISIFIIAIIISYLYKIFLQKFVYWVSDRIYNVVMNVYEEAIIYLLKLK